MIMGAFGNGTVTTNVKLRNRGKRLIDRPNM